MSTSPRSGAPTVTATQCNFYRPWQPRDCSKNGGWPRRAQCSGATKATAAPTITGPKGSTARCTLSTLRLSTPGWALTTTACTTGSAGSAIPQQLLRYFLPPPRSATTPTAAAGSSVTQEDPPFATTTATYASLSSGRPKSAP